MADLSPPRLRGDDRSRGQIILVTGFALAVAFVALALIMNSVIYTENLATRSEAAKASDAVKIRADMADGTAEIIEYVNEHNASDGATYGELATEVRNGVENVSDFVRRYQIVSGQVVELTLIDSRNGTWINQTYEERPFTNKNHDPDWTVVNESGGARALRMHVTDPSMLADLTDPTENFTVVASNGSDTWRMEVAREGTSRILVAVEDGQGDEYTCDVSWQLDVWINVSDGTFAGSKCRALDFGEGIGPVQNVTYLNGDNNYGTYRILVQKKDVNLNDGGLVDDFNATGSPPTTDPAIYDATIHVAYEEQRLVYGTDVTVPGEKDA